MKPKLILHVGLVKTGTSFLQKFIFPHLEDRLLYTNELNLPPHHATAVNTFEAIEGCLHNIVARDNCRVEPLNSYVNKKPVLFSEEAISATWRQPRKKIFERMH